MSDNQLGKFIRNRRERLDPAAFGIIGTRRRTPGLRREEVSTRANISSTWYTCIEQGRGGPPSSAVLDRIAGALMLTEIEREHLFLLGFGHPPEQLFKEVESISPRLQRTLDALGTSPALIKTATWDVVAWNAAASKVLTDFGALPVEQRNILRLLFLDPNARAAQTNWEDNAQFVVAAFRADAARLGASDRTDALVNELCENSPEFATIWNDNDVRSYGEGVKYLDHPTAGSLGLEFSSFVIDGRPDLGMIVYNPVTERDSEKINHLICTTKKC